MNISLRGRKCLDNLPFTQKSWLLNLQASSSSLSFSLKDSTTYENSVPPGHT